MSIVVWKVLMGLIYLVAAQSGNKVFRFDFLSLNTSVRENYLRKFGDLSRQKEFSFKKVKNFGSLKNLTLRVGILTGSDYDYDCCAVKRNGSFFSKESYSHYILELLQNILQFKIKLVPSASLGYYDNFTNSFTDLSNFTVSNMVDLIVCHWSPSEKIAIFADYLFSTLDTTESFVYLPQNLPLTQDVFVETFYHKVWIFFLFAFFLLIVSFRFSTSMHSSVRPDHEPWSWSEVILWAIAAVSQQSYSRHPRGSSCRTMFLIGYTVTYLLYTGFAAGITSLLALQGHRTVLTFDDVANMKLNLVYNSEYHYDFLEEFSKAKQATLNLLQSNQESDLTQIFVKIKKINYVGFGSTVTLVNYLKNKIDITYQKTVAVVTIPHSNRHKSFISRKSFPFKTLFNYWLLRLKETGLLNFGKNRFVQTLEASNYKSTQWLSADLRNVRSAFIFLISGWFLSGFLLLLEIFWKKKQRFKQIFFTNTK